MPLVRPYVKLIFLFLAGSAAAAACSVSDGSGGSAGDCVFGPTCTNMGGDGGPPTSTQIDASGTSGNGMLSDFVDPLCGSGSCNPDNRLSCSDYGQIAARVSAAANADTADAALDAASGGFDANAPEAGAMDSGLIVDAALDATVDGGAASDASVVDAGDGSASAAVSFACRVLPDGDRVSRRCDKVGKRGVGSVCIETSDCDAGLGCVGEPGTGRCLPYCCTGGDACAAGTFCAPRPILDPGSDDEGSSLVPVCVPADHCKLNEPFPCEAGSTQSCVCSPDTACTVVRDDGSTSCVKPGVGKLGEACPCAHDYFCSQATGTCLRVCDVKDTTSNPCGAGKCQTALVFPDGWGVCVGGPIPMTKH